MNKNFKSFNNGELTMFARSMASWMAVAASLTLAACAGEVTDVDRTQPNRVKKSDLSGEWYYRPVVTEVQYNQGVLFEGLEGDMDRVRWEIRELELVAYRSWELLEGAEEGNLSVDGFKGPPVAVFAITSHFDITREYNRATGEQSNVLVENTTDRPWYERDYMRVDWSLNLLDDGISLQSFAQAFSGAPFYVQEHEIDNPDRAEVTGTNINVVNNYVLMSDVWTCNDLFLDPYFCGASNVKLKLSFMKVADRDYEPFFYPDRAHILDPNTNQPIYTDWNGNFCDGSAGVDQAECTKAGIPMFERFGYFRTERRKYNQEEAIWTRDGRVFLANRWNIWADAHDSSGNVKPMRFRDTKQVVYYANADFPADAEAWAGTQALANDWDRAFRETVAEIKKLGGSNVSWESLDPIFVAKQNSCNVENATKFARDNDLDGELEKFGISTISRANLKRACAVLEAKGGFTWQKQGDLRHSFLVWVDTPQVAGPLGYGPSAADPITGEIISANANLYGAAVDSYAAYAADLVALMNGDLELDDVVKGENIRKQVESNRAANFGAFSYQKLDEMKARFRAQAQSMGDNWIPKAEDARAVNRGKLSKVIGSDFEREVLMDDELKRGLLGPDAFQPGATQASDEMQAFSPVQYMAEDAMQRYNKRRIELGSKAIDMADWSDDGMAALAKTMVGQTWEEVYANMRREIYRSVMAHEVGHTLGLRHNFEGSFDALNFAPEFWNSYNDVTGKVDRVDPITGEPTDAEMYMYSTIMDYDARFYADSVKGIGAYDRAAIKFGYGKLVEVFDAGVAAYGFDNFLYLQDYSSIPKMVSGELSCDAAENSDFTGDCEVATGGVLDQFTDAGGDFDFMDYLHDALDSTRAAPENIWKRHYVGFDDLYENWVNAYNGLPYTLPTEVPYKFCPDDYSYPGNVTCQPYDKGANFVEVTQDRMHRYDRYYFFSNFKRDRFTFNDYSGVDAYLGRLVDRYFGPMSNIYRYFLYAESSILGDFPLGEDWQAAAMLGLNYLTSVYQQPEPGQYCLDDRGTTCDGSCTAEEQATAASDDVYRTWASDYSRWTSDPANFAACPTAKQLDIPVGVGKYYLTTWTDEYYYKATRIGTFWDKYAALWALTDNEGSFYRNFNDLLDSGAFTLSYWRGLNTQMLDLFADVFTGNSGVYAWRYDGSAVDDYSKFRAVPLVDVFQDTPNFGVMPRIESASSWTLRYFGVLLPMARFNSMYDYTGDFSNYARVCVEGYSDCVSFDGTGAPVRYTDPLTQYTYVASQTDAPTLEDELDGLVHPERALGARLLEEAQDYADQYAGVKATWQLADDALQDLNANPTTFDITPTEATAVGSPSETTATNLTALQRDQILQLREETAREALADFSEVERGINERSSFLDIVRNISSLTEWGG